MEEELKKKWKTTSKKMEVLFKHKMTDHKNEEVRFKMEITQKFKDALSRQANEAVRISTRPDRELSRVVVERRKKTKHPILT
jgi:hypothetical protein